MDIEFSNNLTTEQRAFKDTAGLFAKEHILPFASEWDENNFFPKEVLKKSAKLGLAGIYIPEDKGGAGLTRLDASIIFEELAYACPSTSAFLSIHNMVGWMISEFGNKETIDKYLPSIISFDKICSYCLTEPNSGSDAAALKTNAVQQKDNKNLLVNGSKSFISGAGTSDIYLTMLKTNMETKKEISCLLVEKKSEGLSFGNPEKKMGWKNQPTALVIFEDCLVSNKNIVGDYGEGFKMAMKGLTGGRVNIASCSLGAARFCIERSINYINERKTFGKLLKDYQSIQFKIADMITELNAARLMVHDAAKAIDKNLPEANVKSAMSKRFATDVCFRICNEALQIHGGYGYLSDYGIEKMVRDTRVHQILEGTNEIMRVIIARDFLKD